MSEPEEKVECYVAISSEQKRFSWKEIHQTQEAKRSFKAQGTHKTQKKAQETQKVTRVIKPLLQVT